MNTYIENIPYVWYMGMIPFLFLLLAVAVLLQRWYYYRRKFGEDARISKNYVPQIGDNIPLELLGQIRSDLSLYIQQNYVNNLVLVSGDKADASLLAFYHLRNNYDSYLYVDFSVYRPENQLDALFFRVMTRLGVSAWNRLVLKALLKSICKQLNIQLQDEKVHDMLLLIASKCKKENIGLWFDKVENVADLSLKRSLIFFINTLTTVMITAQPVRMILDLSDFVPLFQVPSPDFGAFVALRGSEIGNLQYLNQSYDPPRYQQSQSWETFIIHQLYQESPQIFQDLFGVTTGYFPFFHQLSEKALYQLNGKPLTKDPVFLEVLEKATLKKIKLLNPESLELLTLIASLPLTLSESHLKQVCQRMHINFMRSIKVLEDEGLIARTHESFYTNLIIEGKIALWNYQERLQHSQGLEMEQMPEDYFYELFAQDNEVELIENSQCMALHIENLNPTLRILLQEGHLHAIYKSGLGYYTLPIIRKVLEQRYMDQKQESFGHFLQVLKEDAEENVLASIQVDLLNKQLKMGEALSTEELQQFLEEVELSSSDRIIELNYFSKLFRKHYRVRVNQQAIWLGESLGFVYGLQKKMLPFTLYFDTGNADGVRILSPSEIQKG